jgi:hypothetical protein
MAFPLERNDHTNFQNTIEDVYGVLAQYYDLGWLSFRDATWRFGRLHKGSAIRCA